MRVVPYLMLRTPTAVASLVGATLSHIVPRFFAGIVHHSRLIGGLLAPMHVVVIVVVPERPLVLALRVEIFSLVPFLLIPPLLTVVFIFLLHCPFHVHSGII